LKSNNGVRVVVDTEKVEETYWRDELGEVVKKKGKILPKNVVEIQIVKEKIVVCRKENFKSRKVRWRKFRSHKKVKEKVECYDSQRVVGTFISDKKEISPRRQLFRRVQECEKWVFKSVILFFTPHGRGLNRE
jgi:hypothetical protein